MFFCYLRERALCLLTSTRMTQVVRIVILFIFILFHSIYGNEWNCIIGQLVAMSYASTWWLTKDVR